MKFLAKEPLFKLNELYNSKTLSNDFNFNELKNNGFTVIKEFCKNPNDVIAVLEKLWSHENAWQDDVKSDTRLFGIDHKIEYFNNFFLSNEYLYNVYKKYISSNKLSSLIMANRVVPKKGNIGSGGNWHRDDKNGRQLKFILYLTDVTKRNGGFNYIKYTHNPTERVSYCVSTGWSLNKWQFSQQEVEKLPSKYEFTDVIGKAGDLIIVDTSGIHKGSPIHSGSRIALTQYLWNLDEIPQSIKTQMI